MDEYVSKHTIQAVKWYGNKKEVEEFIEFCNIKDPLSNYSIKINSMDGAIEIYKNKTYFVGLVGFNDYICWDNRIMAIEDHSFNFCYELKKT